ncbi:MAG: DUF2442 domain-containing protein [Bryobacteraceae bacterium]
MTELRNEDDACGMGFVTKIGATSLTISPRKGTQKIEATMPTVPRSHAIYIEFRRLGMSIAVSLKSRIQSVAVTDDTISAQLADGRTISVPLAWSWRLSEATPSQRSHFEIIGSGSGIRWSEIDEDISVEGMLHGIPARRLLGH